MTWRARFLRPSSQVAHDVVVDARLLSVYAHGEQRFKVLRVRQVNPYLVVDAVPLADEGADGAFAGAGGGGGGGGGSGGGSFAMASSFASTDVSSSADEAGAAGEAGAAAVAVALVAALERLKVADPYYSEVGRCRLTPGAPQLTPA